MVLKASFTQRDTSAAVAGMFGKFLVSHVAFLFSLQGGP